MFLIFPLSSFYSKTSFSYFEPSLKWQMFHKRVKPFTITDISNGSHFNSICRVSFRDHLWITSYPFPFHKLKCKVSFILSYSFDIFFFHVEMFNAIAMHFMKNTAAEKLIFKDFINSRICFISLWEFSASFILFPENFPFHHRLQKPEPVASISKYITRKITRIKNKKQRKKRKISMRVKSKINSS